MFERLTDRARQALVLAQEEARDLGHDHLGSEHIVLALVRDEGCVAGQILADLGMTLHDARARVRELRGEQTGPAEGWRIPFTAHAKRVLELALSESLALGRGYVGTEHLLLGVLREGEALGAKLLADEGVTAEIVRARIDGAAADAGTAPRVERPGLVVAADDATEAPASPACPRCRALLSGSIAYTTLEVPEHAGDGAVRARFVFCRSCGETIIGKVLED